MREPILVSFFITNRDTLKILEKSWKYNNEKCNRKYVGRDLKETLKVNDAELGGCVALIDAFDLKSGFHDKLNVDVAFGIDYDHISHTFYVTSGKKILQYTNGILQKTLNHNLFNDLHSLQITDNNTLLVTATGTDSILEIDPKNGAIVWEWIATENGFNINPLGQEVSIDRRVNYQLVNTATLLHTTHVNSAIMCNKEGGVKILATLFHQGALLEIDYQSKTSRVVLDNLKSPHHIRVISGGYLISDSRNGKVLYLDKNYKIIAEIAENSNWIQDAIQLSDNTLLIADSNNSRLVRVNKDHEIIDQFSYGERKISTFLKTNKNVIQDIVMENQRNKQYAN